MGLLIRGRDKLDFVSFFSNLAHWEPTSVIAQFLAPFMDKEDIVYQLHW